MISLRDFFDCNKLWVGSWKCFHFHSSSSSIYVMVLDWIKLQILQNENLLLFSELFSLCIPTLFKILFLTILWILIKENAENSLWSHDNDKQQLLFFDLIDVSSMKYDDKTAWSHNEHSFVISFPCIILFWNIDLSSFTHFSLSLEKYK